MTKGRAALPLSVVAEQDPLFIALGGPKAHDSSGRKTFPRGGPLTPQISPLRCAPVEMTKGRAALPATVVAEQDPFSSPWVGLWSMTSPVEMTKGEGGASIEGSCWKNVFHHLGWVDDP